MTPIEKANDFLQNSGKYFEFEKLKLVHDLKSQVEELQKALEWYASDAFARVVKNYYFGETTMGDIGNPARTALQSIQGGDTQ